MRVIYQLNYDRENRFRNMKDIFPRFINFLVYEIKNQNENKLDLAIYFYLMIILGSRCIKNAKNEIGLWSIRCNKLQVEKRTEGSEDFFFLNIN